MRLLLAVKIDDRGRRDVDAGIGDVVAVIDPWEGQTRAPRYDDGRRCHRGRLVAAVSAHLPAAGAVAVVFCCELLVVFLYEAL